MKVGIQLLLALSLATLALSSPTYLPVREGKCGAGWVWLNPYPNGEYHDCVVKTRLGILFYTGGTGGTLTSDGGASWENFDIMDTSGMLLGQTGPLLDDPSIHFVNDSVGFSLIPDPGVRHQWHLYKSTNGGTQWFRWSTISSPGTVMGHVRMVDERNGWYTASDFHGHTILSVHRTHDGGRTWSTVKLDTTASVDDYQYLFFLDSLHGWVAGLVDTNQNRGRWFSFRTDDGGASWAVLDTSRQYLVRNIVYKDSLNGVRDRYANGKQYLDRTTDGGYLWRALADPIDSRPDSDITVAWHYGASGIVTVVVCPAKAVDKTSRFATTGDYGTSWNRDSFLFGKTVDFTYIPIHVFDDSTAVALPGFLLTVDHGRHWIPFDTLGGFHIYDWFFVSRTTGFIYGDYDVSRSHLVGLLMTRDQGQHWSRVPEIPIDIWYHSAFHADHIWVGDTSRLFVSHDRGETFREITTLPAHVHGFLNVSFVDSVNGWLFSYCTGIWRTTNGGQDWVRQRSEDSCTNGYVSMIDTAEGWFLGGTSLHTTNGGITWLTVDIPYNGLNPTGITFPTRSHGYVFGDGTTSETIDGGNTWHDYPHSGSNMHWTDSLFGWVASELTTDGGASWLPRSCISASLSWWSDTATGWAANSGPLGNDIYHYGTFDSVPVGVHEVVCPSFPNVVSNFPNPASHVTTLHFADSVLQSYAGTSIDLRLYDAFGRLIYIVHNLVFFDGRECSVELPLTGVHSGAYLCVIHVGTHTITHRFTVVL